MRYRRSKVQLVHDWAAERYVSTPSPESYYYRAIMDMLEELLDIYDEKGEEEKR